MKQLIHLSHLGIIGLVTAMLFSSCKKKDLKPCPLTVVEDYSPDTILPSDYLMTYPGSWWKYSDGKTDSCEWGLITYSQHVFDGKCTTIYKDNKLVPHTNHGYFAFDKEIIPLEEYAQPEEWRVLDTVVGTFLDYTGDRGSGKYAYKLTLHREVVEKLPSMVVQGVTYQDVIHVYSYDKKQPYHYAGSGVLVVDTYYARNVGIIKTVTSQFAPSVTRELIAYHIAPH